MATSYDTIFNAALSRITDDDLLQLAERDIQDVMLGYLKAAQADFLHLCEFDLSQYDDDAMEYAEDLDDEVIEILALGVAAYWCSAKALNAKLFRNVLNTKDYTFFSPATLMTSLRTLRDSLQREYQQKIINYTYMHGDIAGLKV